MPARPATVALVETKTLTPPSSTVLQLYRYLWQPARYAHCGWLRLLGFHPAEGWRYGQQPPLDHCLDQALRQLRGTPVIQGKLTERQQRIVDLAPRMYAYALGLGLVKIGCSDYFMLPSYRQALHPWLEEGEIWQLLGWCGQRRMPWLSSTAMVQTAIQVGTSMLHRAARDEVVLQAQLILLPPPERALWPRISLNQLSLLERIL